MKIITSDLVEKLRALQQMMILAGVALLLTLFLIRQPEDILAALQELNQIQKVTQGENWNQRFIKDYFQRNDGLGFLYEDGGYITHYKSWRIEFQAKELSVRNEPLGFNHIVPFEAPIDIFVGWDYSFDFSKGVDLSVPSPKTIKEFADIWNRSRNVTTLTVMKIADYAYVQRNLGLPVEKVAITILDDQVGTRESSGGGKYGVFAKSIFSDEFIDRPDRDLYGLTDIIEEFYFYSNWWKIWIPAYTSNKTTFDASAYLCEKMQIKKEGCSGPFEQVFPNIYLMAKDYNEFPLGNVEEVLNRQMEDRLQNFEVAGFKIPVSILNVIGSIILVALQTYYFLHLHNLTYPNLSDELPAWIGIFRDWMSRSLAVISVTFFPILVIFILNIKITSALTIEVLSRMFFCVSIGVSFFISRDFRILWEKIDNTNSHSMKPFRSINTRKQNRNR